MADRSVNKAFVRALKLTAAIDENPRLVLPLAFDEVARRRGDAPALLSERGNLTCIRDPFEGSFFRIGSKKVLR